MNNKKKKKSLSLPHAIITCCHSDKCLLASWGCRRDSVSHLFLIGCCGCPSVVCPQRWTRSCRWTWWTARRRRRVAGTGGRTETSSLGGTGQSATPPPVAQNDAAFWCDGPHVKSSSGKCVRFQCDGHCILWAWLCPLTLKSEEQTWWEWSAASPAWYMTWWKEQRTTITITDIHYYGAPHSAQHLFVTHITTMTSHPSLGQSLGQLNLTKDW